MTQTTPFGSATSGLKRLIRREVRASSETLAGTVLSIRRLEDLDAAGSSTWVVDVDVGAPQPLRSVAVKAGSNGERFYAGLGQPVKLARNLQGRFDVIGPGDRKINPAIRSSYTLGFDTPTSSGGTGLQTQRVAFEFYEGIGPPNSLWNDGATAFPLIRIVDALGNPV